MLLRMHDDDRAKYGGPEWLDISAAVEALNDLDWDVLNALDDQIFNEIGDGLILSIGQLSAMKLSAQRVALWLGLWHADVILPFADFKPTKPLRFNLNRGRADAIPPASTPGSSDTSISATTPEPETSSSASTPGSRARTSSSRAKSAR